MNYNDFLEKKRHSIGDFGFDTAGEALASLARHLTQWHEEE